MKTTDPLKTLLDIGIGNNIDDAFALAAAATSPELTLLGVTTTGSEPHLRTLLARRLLGVYGRTDVPVATGGFSGKDEDRIYPSSFTQKHLATESEPLAPQSPADAADFMADVLARHQHVTVIATAPLTNVAALLQRHPSVTDRIDQIVFMGGWTSQALPEYNIANDPEAAARVIESDIPLVAIGYEVSLNCYLRRPHLAWLRRADAPGAVLLQAFFDEWQRVMRDVPPLMHDPLTVAYAVNPNLFQRERLHITIDAEEGPGQGVIQQDDVRGRPITLCTAVDTMATLNWLMSRVTSSPEVTTRVDLSRWVLRPKEAYTTTHHPHWSLTLRDKLFHTLGFVQKGTCHIDNRTLQRRETAPERSVFYVPSRADVTFHTEEETQILWIRFFVHQLKDQEGEDGTDDHVPVMQQVGTIAGMDPLYPPGEHLTGLIAMAEQTARQWIHPLPEGGLITQANLLQIVAGLLTLSHDMPADQSDAAKAAVLKTKLYIEEHAHEQITLEQLSDLVNVSKYYLTRIFRQQLGVPPLAYQRHIRIKQAKRLLANEQPSIQEIATYIGYHSQSAFSRVFHRETGMTPSEYRHSLIHRRPS